MVAFILFLLFIFICYMFLNNSKQKQLTKSQKREIKLLEEINQTYSKQPNKNIDNSIVSKTTSDETLDNIQNNDIKNFTLLEEQQKIQIKEPINSIVQGKDLKSQILNLQIQIIKIQKTIKEPTQKSDLSKIIFLLDEFIKNLSK